MNNNISLQIQETVSLIINGELDKVAPLYGAYRPFEALRVRLKDRFPSETSLDNDESAIKFIKRFIKNGNIFIINDFEDRRTKKSLTVYTLPKSSAPTHKDALSPQHASNTSVAKNKTDDIKLPELRRFAFFLNFDEMLSDVAQMAKPEKWRFGCSAGSESTNKYPILKSYLYQVFSRLKYESEVLGLENKIVIVDCDAKSQNGEIIPSGKCAFNTGLISNNGNYIYLLFDKNNRPGAQEWFYKSVSDDIYSQNFLPFKNNIPKIADFYNELSSSTLVYHKEVVAINTDHILSDHCERLPIKFLRQYFGDYYKFKGDAENPLLTSQDWNDFKKYIKDKEQRYEYNDARTKLHQCIIEAQRKARSGDAFRVHIYRPELHTVGFFLPLYLVKPKDETDFEVGVIVDNSANDYVARTIYQTSMAYDKVRVMGLQYRTWLNPSKIKYWINPYSSEMKINSGK